MTSEISRKQGIRNTSSWVVTRKVKITMIRARERMRMRGSMILTQGRKWNIYRRNSNNRMMARKNLQGLMTCLRKASKKKRKGRNHKGHGMTSMRNS